MNFKQKTIKAIFNQLFFGDQKKELDAIKAQKKYANNFITDLENSVEQHDDLIAFQKTKIEHCNQLNQSLEQLQSQLDFIKNSTSKTK